MKINLPAKVIELEDAERRRSRLFARCTKEAL